MSNPQVSLTLNSTIIAPGFASNGNPTDGQIPSLTSTNNFINFCLTYPSLPITNGTQIRTGSCNPAPMGAIPSIQNIPSAKFTTPKYGDNVQANTDFTVSVVVNNLQGASFVDPNTNYLAAPQQLNSQGFVIGNAVIVIEPISNFTQSEPTDAKRFSYAQSLAFAPVNGVLSTTVRNGLPSGVYRLSTQLRATNHQPILVSVSQHGALDDVVYFTVGDGQGSASPSVATGGVVESNVTAAATNTQDSAQSSLTLDPNVLARGFEQSGSTNKSLTFGGLTSSLTSTNNFINFCLQLPESPITNGNQVQAGSCNPVPMGVIPSTEQMPSSKFTNPKNGDSIPAGQAFTISLAVRNLQTGALTNTEKSFMAAPQQVNAQGLIIGHAKVVIEALTGFNQTTPTDPTKFAFFQHISSPAQDGVLTAAVDKGLPDGFYRLSSILAAATSQPVLVPVNQLGYVNDAVYFTVGDPSKASTSQNGTTDGNKTSTAPSQGNSVPPSQGNNLPLDPSRSRVNKAAIIGGLLGGVLGAIILGAVVFVVLRYRRRLRKLSDTETVRLPFTEPYYGAASNANRRLEKALPARPDEQSGLSSATSILGGGQMAESSHALPVRSLHGEVLGEPSRPASTAWTELPPYRP